MLNPRIVNEARFLYATRAISNGVSADPDAPNIDVSGVGSFNGNANGTRKTLEKGMHIVDSLTMTLGRHVVKAGFDLLPVSFRERTTNINGSFVFGGLPAVAGVRDAVTPLNQFLLTEQRTIDPATGRPYSYSRFTQSIGAEYFEAATFNQGYFIQDDFRLNDRLKLNLGLALRILRPSARQSESGSAADREVRDRRQQLRAALRLCVRSHRLRPHRDPRRRRRSTTTSSSRRPTTRSCAATAAT